MKKALFALFILSVFLASFLTVECGAESITYMNLTNDLRDELIIEKTISPREGIDETTVNIYKYTLDSRLKLVWRGIKRMGFLSVLDRLPPHESTSRLPFCLISDISVIDLDGGGIMEIEMTTKKVYYDEETRSKVISEEPVHTRIFRWDSEDQRYE